MKLGFSYWGFCSEYEDSNVIETPDGGRFTRPIFVKELRRRGIEIICLQKRREEKPIDFLIFRDDYPKLDALFVEWRWSTYKNDVKHPLHKKEYYEPDLDRQWQILSYYAGRVPIVIWDTDLMVNNDDILKLDSFVIWTEPTIIPTRENFRSLLYFTDYGLELFDCCDNILPQYVYIGSNYERYWGVTKYYYSIAPFLKKNNIEIKFWGNWLNFSPERPEQEKRVKEYSKFITFNKRNKFLDGMLEINRSICVTHILKEKYCKYGLITPRFFESLACNTPAFIPEEFVISDLYGDWWVADDVNLADKIQCLYLLDNERRRELVYKQKANLRTKLPETSVDCFVNKLLGFLGG